MTTNGGHIFMMRAGLQIIDKVTGYMTHCHVEACSEGGVT